MLNYRSLHNCESKAGAAVASRKIRLEQSTKISRFDSPPRVYDFGAQQTPVGIKRRYDLDLFLTRHLGKRVESIVDQVNKHAFNISSNIKH